MPRPSQAAQTNGFRIARELSIGDLDIHLVVLQVPPSRNIVKALRALREADPAGTYDFNHIYTGVGALSTMVSAAQPDDPPSPQGIGADRADQPLRAGSA